MTVSVRNRKILGLPFWLFALPMAAHGSWKERRRTPLNPNSGEREDAQDVWESVELCFDCNKDRLHQFILWRDEPVVTSECTFCQAIRERADLGA